MSLILSGAMQVGFIVKDIRGCMMHWSEKLKVGPWAYREKLDVLEYRYYGEEVGFPDLSIALANSGSLQLELIQQNNDTPSLYLDTLKRNGEIAQHISYWTETEFDAWGAYLKSQGYKEGMAGRFGQATNSKFGGQARGRFAYFIHEDLPSCIIEIGEQTGGKTETFENIRRAAEVWDGSDPIRDITRFQ